MKRQLPIPNCHTGASRRGSTLVIVISLLGLLAFTGMVFYSFSSQERASAEYFSEAAKVEVFIPDDPFPYALEQLIVGANNRQKNSIVYSPTAHNSLLRNLVGPDIAPHTGSGIRIIYDSSTGLPVIDQDYDGTADVTPDQSDPADNGAGTQSATGYGHLSDHRNFVDSVAAWGEFFRENEINSVRDYVGANARPHPDVDYTYPDINNLFLSYHGYAIRDNGSTVTPRFERVPVIIPSFFRPQYLKSSTANGPSGSNVPTDVDWWDNTAHPTYRYRSFAPHPNHVVIDPQNGNKVFRFLDANRAGDALLIATLPNASGPFPFRPNEGDNGPDFGKLGLWTGHDPTDSTQFRLYSDNDGDGIREGIWMDLDYPIQETTGGVFYATLHSFTIRDLDGLIDLNVHGNLAGLDRTATINTSILGGGTGMKLGSRFLSQSNHGLGPNEISPLWALAPTSATPDTGTEFTQWYGANPVNRLEQANMELIWLMTGRMSFDSTASKWDDIFEGRWGDANALWYHKNTAGGTVWSLPRPGRSGNQTRGVSSGEYVSFAGKQGYDDNGDRLEGIASTVTGIFRGFVHPLDYSGRGDIRSTGDVRIPNLNQDLTNSPENWLQYDGYSLVGNAANLLTDSAYIKGRNGTYNGGASDDLIINPTFNPLLDDPAEMVQSNELAVRPDDQFFGPEETIYGQLYRDADQNLDEVSKRLQNLAPFTFANSSIRSDMFTTSSGGYRFVPLSSPYGADGRPGIANEDDDGDNTVDEPDEVLFDLSDGERHSRYWEFTADTDGADRDNDGYGDGDGNLEFPPKFGSVTPYSKEDPFRPQVRRVLTIEAGEQQSLLGQLPLSINHLLDVNRNSDTPAETTTAFLRYMQRAGLRFRQLTEHPNFDELDAGGGQTAAAAVTTVPELSGGTNVSDIPFPPRLLADREFWARRDRQQMARDIYVLLYTMGGAQFNTAGNGILDYTGDNSSRTIYSEARLRQMAQFAVNLVDALDTDNVITKFEYDKNLGDDGSGLGGNGWNLDDDPATASNDTGIWSKDAASGSTYSSGNDVTGNGLYPEDTGDRGVVYGVEGQQLTIGEVLAVHSKAEPTDPAETVYSDGTDRFFMHVELQNLQPVPVKLALTETGTSNENLGIWRIVRKDRTGMPEDPQLTVPTETMTFMNGNPDISAGGRFSLGMAAVDGNPGDTNPTEFGTADLYVSTGSASSYTLISPDIGANSSPLPSVTLGATPDPYLDLDLIHTTHSSRWLMAGNSTQPGQFLANLNPPPSASTVTYDGNDDFGFAPVPGRMGFDLALERRQNPNLPGLSVTANPWVEVDRFRVFFTDLLDGGGMVQLDQIPSVERIEPLNATAGSSGFHPPYNSASNPRMNSIANVNDTNRVDASSTTNLTATPFLLWQPHFDRDFASTGELLQLPIVGPNLLTSRLNRMRFDGLHQSYADPTTPSAPGTENPDLIASAGGMFLHPVSDPLFDPNSTSTPTPPTAASTAADNRWYRLFQFVEVPSRINRMLGNYLNLTRLPGKLNPNMIRHREVYAGLIDDPAFGSVPVLSDSDADGIEDGPFLTSAAVDGVNGTPGFDGTTAGQVLRDRWQEFLNERDGLVAGYDPAATAAASFWVPGTPNSRPFRSHAYTTGDASLTGARTDNGMEETLLRRLSRDTVREGSTAYDPGGSTTPLQTNRHWLEVGSRAFHTDPTSVSPSSTALQRHQILSKILNNTTTVSNNFIVYGTAAYFEAVPDPTTGLFRIGGRMGLDNDGDGVPENDSGWEQRAVFILDRTEVLNAFDAGSNDFDWERLLKHRVNLQSDGQ